MKNKKTHTVSRLAGAIMASAALLPVASHANSFAEIAKLEREKLKVLVQEIDGQIIEAREAYAAENYQKSYDLNTQALAKLPSGRVFDERRVYLKDALSQSTVALSKTQIRQGDVQGARENLDAVLAVDPGNVSAQKELDYSYDPIRTNPILTKDHAVNVDKVRRLLYQGEGFYNSGQYDKALLEFDAVLRIDPYNMAARRWQSKVHRERSAYGRSAYDEARSRLLTEVDLAWQIAPAPITEIRPEVGTGGDTVIDPLETNKRKLDLIMVPRLDLQDTPLDEAISLLQSIARDNDPQPDPDKKGVNFVVRYQKSAGGEDGESIDGNQITIDNLQLNNVPLKEALRQICLKCKPLMRYKIEEYSVAVVPAVDGGEDNDLFTRRFNVVPGFKGRLGAGEGATQGGEEPGGLFSSSSTEAAAPKSIKELLSKMGVVFPDGASANYIAVGSSLVVTNTAVGLDQVAKIVEDINNQTPKMIKITSKFVEVNQQDTDELGFDWIVSPFGLTANSLYLGGGSSGSGVARTASDFSSAVGDTSISGVPTSGEDVFNTLSGGLRSGDTAITRDSINSFLNNPTRSSQDNDVAPGILTLTGLFSESQVQMVMRGLAQKKGSDVMNAPSVVAKPGETARIEVVRQFIYPTEYDPPELPTNIGSTGTGDDGGVTIVPITPATPSAFETVPTGVILEVTPEVGEGTDSKTISLKLEPEIVEFEGFINYGSPIQAIGTDALGNAITVTITENRIEQPVFSKRTVQTNLTIYDGHTVSIGGLMSEEVQKVEDKIPVLGDLPLVGRLFQSNSENRIKSNLVIFVTANLIDPTGRNLHGSQISREESESSSLGLISSDLLPAPQL